MRFIPSYSESPTIEMNALCILFNGDAFGVLDSIDEGQIGLPCYSDLPEGLQSDSEFHFLGVYGEVHCYVVLSHVDVVGESFRAQTLRDFLVGADTESAVLLNLAYHLYRWDMNSQFCGRCGGKNEFMAKERGKQCNCCELTVYPIISPCIIVAIVKDNRSILLAEIKRNNAVFHSVLAGFVEAGETLEQAVAREVMEEVGIKVCNIQYFGSQPWSFSQSLMVGFTADYDSGEIDVDGVEIHFADWYPADELPALPPKFSIARQLIEWFYSNAASHI